MTWAHRLIAIALVTLFVASVAAPGLTMHNCRQFGTKSTQMCACCVAELEAASGCCAKKSEAVAPVCHESDFATLESSCCFVSYEEPFSFEGQSSAQVSAPASQQSVALALQNSIASDFAPAFEIDRALLNYDSRHSSDPPSYILTHSFRC